MTAADPLVLAVVPARGGSRGVPRKNIRMLGGHPLLAYTIAAGRASDRLTDLVVSTEDPEIAEVARSYGAAVIQRPDELATDEAPTAPVIQHAIAKVEQTTGRTYDYILTLQPTTPFRRGWDIDAAVALLNAAPHPDASVTSVARIYDAHPIRVKRLDGDRLMPYIGGDDLPTRRQDLPPAYLRNGAIYLAHRHTVTGGSVWGNPELPYEMPPERSVNIDEPLDFLLAEAVLGAGLTEIDLLLEARERLTMHPSNDYYGHDMILSWAASIHRPKRTFGYVQHGWKPESAFGREMRLIPRAPLFVWSEANRVATAAAHPRHPVEAIGAPFLYLYELMRPALDREPTKDLLVYPCHQLRSAPLAREVHTTLIEQVRDLAPQSITVNLHPYEFDDGATPGLYEADLPGAIVTTNWLRPPWVVSDDPTILVRQMLQILDHRRVVSNCLTTALLYAAHLGRDARLLRHPARRQPPTEGRGRALHEELEQATDGAALAAIAGRELGAEHLRTPEELRRVMGWDSARRTAVATGVRWIGRVRS